MNALIFMDTLFMNTQFMNIFQKKNENENENKINIHEYKHSTTTNRKSFGALNVANVPKCSFLKWIFLSQNPMDFNQTFMV